MQFYKILLHHLLNGASTEAMYYFCYVCEFFLAKQLNIIFLSVLIRVNLWLKNVFFEIPILSNRRYKNAAVYLIIYRNDMIFNQKERECYECNL